MPRWRILYTNCPICGSILTPSDTWPQSGTHVFTKVFECGTEVDCAISEGPEEVGSTCDGSIKRFDMKEFLQLRKQRVPAIKTLDYLHIIIPVYYTQTFKTKPDKTFLVNLNWYRNAHYFIKNEVKQAYNELIITYLKANNIQPIPGKYELAFEYYYKSVVSDLDNVCAMANKHCNDAFQAYGLVENDNVKYCIKSTYYVKEQDKKNPRIEVYVRAIPEEDK